MAEKKEAIGKYAQAIIQYANLILFMQKKDVKSPKHIDCIRSKTDFKKLLYVVPSSSSLVFFSLVRIRCLYLRSIVQKRTPSLQSQHGNPPSLPS